METVRAVFPLLVVAVFLFVFAKMGLGNLRRRRWPQARGVIVQVAHNRTDPDSASFRVQVSFRTADGQAAEAWTINQVGYETTRTPGTPVVVTYDPADPARCYAHLPGQKSAAPTVAFAVAVLTFVLVVLYLVV